MRPAFRVFISLLLVLGVVLAATTGAAVAQTYVNAGGFLIGARSLQVRPTAMHLLSNENLSHVRWSKWGGARAIGHGTDASSFPSSGHRGRNPVAIALQDRRRCGRIVAYTTVRVRFTNGVPYSKQPPAETIRFGCPSK